MELLQWKQLQEGNPAAWDWLYDTFVNNLFNYGMKIKNDRELVKDCIQELFVDLWNSRKNLILPESPKLYLLKSLKYKILRATKTPEINNSSNLFQINEYEPSYESFLIEDQLYQEQQENLRNQINKLSPKQREAIMLRFFENLNHEEIANVLEIKHLSRRDSTTKKLRIFDNLVFSGSYNVTGDSLKWSPINTGGLFRLFKGLSNLTWNAEFDPYITNARGQRINRFAIREQGRLLRTTRLNVALNTSFTIGDLRDRILRRDVSADAPAPSRSNAADGDDFVSWLEDFRITHRVTLERRLLPTGVGQARDPLFIGSNNISLSGRIPISSNWRIDIGNIAYDFKQKSMVYPDLGFSRDLHCWELSLSWQPLRGTYLFSINVRPGSLDFLKIPYRKNNFDGALSF